MAGGKLILPPSQFVLFIRGMVSMVSMSVSKTVGSGSSPDTPAREIKKFRS